MHQNSKLLYKKNRVYIINFSHAITILLAKGKTKSEGREKKNK